MSKLRIKIEHVEDAQDPRTEYDQQTTFAFFHKRYTLGDKDHGLRSEDFRNWGTMEEHIRKEIKPVYLTAVYMYDHSGITIKSIPFLCLWDSGQIGFAWITRKQLAECAGNFKRLTKALKARAEEIVESDIKVYDQYLTGDVWEFLVEKQENKGGEWELEDSCSGFRGSDWRTNGMADHIQKLVDGGAEIVEVP